MIQLRSDCLIVQTQSGECIPCSAEIVTIELIGNAVKSLDPVIIQQASAAVLHYFKHELGKVYVSVAEFSCALERVLTQLKVSIDQDDDQTAELTFPVARNLCADLKEIAEASCPGVGFEILFYSRLREDLQLLLASSPQVLRLEGLKSCVKYLAGAKRWSRRCDCISDEIVEYIREVFSLWQNNECGLVVS